MPKAIFISVHNGLLFKKTIDHSMISPPTQNSYSFETKNVSRRVTVEENRCTYTNELGATYCFELPNYPGIDKLKAIEPFGIYHGSNKQKSIIRSHVKGTWITRIIFNHPDLIDNTQILFCYDGGLNPLDVPDYLIDQPIQIQRARLF